LVTANQLLWLRFFHTDAGVSVIPSPMRTKYGSLQPLPARDKIWLSGTKLQQGRLYSPSATNPMPVIFAGHEKV